MLGSEFELVQMALPHVVLVMIPAPVIATWATFSRWPLFLPGPAPAAEAGNRLRFRLGDLQVSGRPRGNDSQRHCGRHRDRKARCAKVGEDPKVVPAPLVETVRLWRRLRWKRLILRSKADAELAVPSRCGGRAVRLPSWSFASCGRTPDGRLTVHSAAYSRRVRRITGAPSAPRLNGFAFATRFAVAQFLASFQCFRIPPPRTCELEQHIPPFGIVRPCREDAFLRLPS